MKKAENPLNEVAHTNDSHDKKDMIAYMLLAAVLLSAAYLYYTNAI